jgi:DNA-binding transcriptional ArsR family regulator
MHNACLFINKILGTCPPANRSRLKILYALSHDQELCVCDIATLLKVKVAIASHHLRKLRDLKILKYRNDGKLAYYSLTRSASIRDSQLLTEAVGGLGILGIGKVCNVRFSSKNVWRVTNDFVSCKLLLAGLSANYEVCSVDRLVVCHVPIFAWHPILLPTVSIRFSIPLDPALQPQLARAIDPNSKIVFSSQLVTTREDTLNDYYRAR